MNKNPQYCLKSSQKLKFLIFLVFSFLFCQNICSQFTWQRTYQSNVGGDDEGYDGCAADGSNFYIVGYTGVMDYNFYVAKLNQFGDTVWSRAFLGGLANSVVSSGDGGCVFTGLRSAPFTIKMNATGQIVWDKTYSNGGEAHDIARTNDSGYVLCGGFLSGYICKLDSLGNLQWERFYSDNQQDFHSIELAIGGGYIVGGRKYINNTWRSYLMKIDGSGNVIWETYLMFPNIVKSFVKNDNGYIIAMSISTNSLYSIILCKTNVNGLVYKIDTLTRPPDLTGVRSIVKNNNFKYVLVGYMEREVYPFGYIGKVISIDSNSNVIKELTLIPETNSLYINKIIKAPGSILDDIICIGAAEPNSPHDLDLYVTRLDSTLNPPPPLSLTLISSQIPTKNELIANFPNPFNGATKIKFTIKKSGFAQIRVFDILGREIVTLVFEVLSAGTYSKIFNPRSLSSGVYFYQFVFDGKVISTQKMIYSK